MVTLPKRKATGMNRDKTQMALVDLGFVRKMAAVLHEGNRRYPEREPGDWRDRTWDSDTILEYRSALLRHLLAAEKDPEAYAAVAVNAMILAECQGRGDLVNLLGESCVLETFKEWCSREGLLEPVFHWYPTYGHPVCGSNHTIASNEPRISPTSENMKTIAYCNTCVDRLRDTPLGLTSSEAEGHVNALLDLLPPKSPMFEGWKTRIESGSVPAYHWYSHVGVPICGADIELPKNPYASIRPEIEAPVCEVCAQTLVKQGVSNYGMTEQQVQDALEAIRKKLLEE